MQLLTNKIILIAVLLACCLNLQSQANDTIILNNLQSSCLSCGQIKFIQLSKIIQKQKYVIVLNDTNINILNYLKNIFKNKNVTLIRKDNKISKKSSFTLIKNKIEIEFNNIEELLEFHNDKYDLKYDSIGVYNRFTYINKKKLHCDNYISKLDIYDKDNKLLNKINYSDILPSDLYFKYIDNGDTNIIGGDIKFATYFNGFIYIFANGYKLDTALLKLKNTYYVRPFTQIIKYEMSADIDMINRKIVLDSYYNDIAVFSFIGFSNDKLLFKGYKWKDSSSSKDCYSIDKNDKVKIELKNEELNIPSQTKEYCTIFSTDKYYIFNNLYDSLIYLIDVKNKKKNTYSCLDGQIYVQGEYLYRVTKSESKDYLVIYKIDNEANLIPLIFKEINEIRFSSFIDRNYYLDERPCFTSKDKTLYSISIYEL